MNQCQATNANGKACRRQIRKGQRYCGHHRGFDWKRALLMAGGAIVGNLVLPGAGGMAAGAIIANVADRANLSARHKKRVFLSFDYSHDRKMKTLFVGQSKLDKSPFEIVDHSLQEAAPEETWIDHAAEAIANTDLLVVLLGEHTWRAPGVLIEVDLARRLGRPAVQIYAYKDMRVRPLLGVRGPYPWDWKVLAHILD